MSLSKLKAKHTHTHTHNPQETVKKRQREYTLPSSSPQNMMFPHTPTLCLAIFLNPFCKGQKSSTNLFVSLPNIPLKNIQPPSKSNEEGLLYP